MSDTHSLSESSATTIEDLPFDTIVSNLELAALEAIESEDYLSYSTILDIYLADASKFSDDEKEILMTKLHKVLQEHPQLTYEVAWDLPLILIEYFVLGITFLRPLRETPCVYEIFKLFETLAKLGNPKELFLKSCELLSSIKVSDVTDTDDPSIKERYYGLKMYCVFELINSSLKRIETLYPSRFLSMCISAFINSIYINLESTISMEFVLKRVYSFARNYDASPLPKDHGLSPKELKEITDDENYLQRKLLKGFVTNIIFLVGKNWSPSYSVMYFGELSNKTTDPLPNMAVNDMLYLLCSSFDIDLGRNFKDLIVSSHELFHKFDLSKDEDELMGDIFETVVINYQDNLLRNIVGTDAKQIEVNKLGCLIYYAHLVVHFNAVDTAFFPVNVTFTDVLILTLKLVIPMMVSPSFENKAIKDLMVFWSWYAIQKLNADKKKLSLELSSIPKVYLNTYFQLLLYICSSSDFEEKDFRFGALTLLTKVLGLAPEQISYHFIIDSLRDHPLSNVRTVMIGVLKELLTKDKTPEKGLEKELENLSLENKPPSLPSRSTEKATKYLTLSQSIFEDILEVVRDTVESVFEEDYEQDSETETEESHASKSYKVKFQLFGTLVAGLNLLVVLKQEEIFKKNSEKVDKQAKDLNLMLDSLRVQYKDSENELKAVDLLSITMDRLTA